MDTLIVILFSLTVTVFFCSLVFWACRMLSKEKTPPHIDPNIPPPEKHKP